MALSATEKLTSQVVTDLDGRTVLSTGSSASPTVVSRESVTTTTPANVAASATVVTLQALNTARKGWTVYNDSTSVLYVKFASAASATSYSVQIAPGQYYEMPAPVYTGIITGIWATANGNARVTEL